MVRSVDIPVWLWVEVSLSQLHNMKGCARLLIVVKPHDIVREGTQTKTRDATKTRFEQDTETQDRGVDGSDPKKGAQIS